MLCISGIIDTFEKVVLLETVTEVLSADPFLVVISTTPAAAALGTILRLKPVLQIQGEKLDAYSKARTYKIAKNTMLDAIAKDIEERFDGKSSPEDIYIAIAHTDNLAAAEEFRDEVKAIYPEHDIYIDHLSLSVACHIGPGALAITATKVLKY